MHRVITIVAATVGLSVANAALAHGPQIQITNDNGQIVTRELFVEQPYDQSLSSPKSVYVMPLSPSAVAGGTEWYARPNPSVTAGLGLPTYVSGPGIAYGYGSTYDAGTGTGTVAFPVGSHFMLSLNDGLKRWNGSAFVDPGTEQLQAFRVSNNQVVASATTSDAGPFQSFDFPDVTAPTSPDSVDAHQGVRYRLLGDGSSSTSSAQDGIYLVSMRLASSHAGVSPSDPFHYVLYKNVPLPDVQTIVASVFPNGSLVQIVPEPAGAALLALGAIVLLRRGKR
jgi:hypothetical protein